MVKHQSAPLAALRRPLKHDDVSGAAGLRAEAVRLAVTHQPDDARSWRVDRRPHVDRVVVGPVWRPAGVVGLGANPRAQFAEGVDAVLLQCHGGAPSRMAADTGAPTPGPT